MEMAIILHESTLWVVKNCPIGYLLKGNGVALSILDVSATVSMLGTVGKCIN